MSGRGDVQGHARGVADASGRLNVTESVRKLVIDDLFGMKGFNGNFPSWLPAIQEILWPRVNHEAVLDLGAALSAVFRLTREEGRDQGSLAGGGASWEGLVCWYLNLCLLGTPAVVIKKKGAVPRAILDALVVRYGNHQTNTESDLIAVTAPPASRCDFADDPAAVLDHHVAEHFGETEVCVIQCKTNWNDNAQIPMLWDMLYASSGFRNRNIAIGQNGRHIRDLKQFAYAFATVPSNTRDKHGSNSMPVVRVRNLSGGNYWGQPTRSGTALALGEMIANNFTTAVTSTGSSWANHVTEQLRWLGSTYSFMGLTESRRDQVA